MFAVFVDDLLLNHFIHDTVKTHYEGNICLTMIFIRKIGNFFGIILSVEKLNIVACEKVFACYWRVEIIGRKVTDKFISVIRDDSARVAARSI